MSIPARLDLQAYQGDTFSKTFTFLDAAKAPIDLSGSSWKAQIRRDNTAVGEELAEFSIDDTAAGSGVIVISLDQAQTVELPRDGFWDLERTDTGRTYVGGKFSVRREITT